MGRFLLYLTPQLNSAPQSPERVRAPCRAPGLRRGKVAPARCITTRRSSPPSYQLHQDTNWFCGTRRLMLTLAETPLSAADSERAPHPLLETEFATHSTVSMTASFLCCTRSLVRPHGVRLHTPTSRTKLLRRVGEKRQLGWARLLWQRDDPG